MYFHVHHMHLYQVNVQQVIQLHIYLENHIITVNVVIEKNIVSN